MKKILTLLLMICATMGLWAQGVKPLPTLHVEGKWLVDKHGNHVVLHGVMDTPNMYFNGWRWGDPWGQGVSYDENGAKRCINYFNKVFVGLEKAKCDVFRLHLDPAWTNDPDANYSYEGAAGQPAEAKDEADISKFNPTRLESFLNSLYFPLASNAMKHGMFVVMRPPGVCPPNLKVGDYYQKYLIKVWDIVTQNDSVKKYAGQISIELANEPVNVRNRYNQDDTKALRDYFQPVVDKIRENGFTGIIWVPGTGWQSNYRSYSSYPIQGTNIGYAVHDYNGWYGCNDSYLNDANVAQAAQSKIKEFRNSVPVVNTYPIIITEVDWSPIAPGTGHYNEHNEWVESNYGTWATGRTSYWGRCYKAMLDYFKNISMTLSGTSCLIDVDTLLQKNKVVPAFGGLEEACGKACLDWYADYYNVDWPHDDMEGTPEYETATAIDVVTGLHEMMVGDSLELQFNVTYLNGRKMVNASGVTLTSAQPQVVTVAGSSLQFKDAGETEVTASFTDRLNQTITNTFVVKSSYFPFLSQYINRAVKGENNRFNERLKIMHPSANGEMGWIYADGADLSAYKYLVLQLDSRSTAANMHLNIYGMGPVETADCYSSPDFGSELQIVIPLKEITYATGEHQGQPVDLSHVGAVSIWGNGENTVYFKDVYVTNNDDFTAVETVRMDKGTKARGVYNLKGQLVRRGTSVEGLPAGIYIVDGKKVRR